MCEFCKTHLTAYLREDTGYGVWHLWLRPHRAYNVRLLKPHVGNSLTTTMSASSRRPSWLSWYENQVSAPRPTATAAVTVVLDAELSRLGLDRSPAARTAALDAEAADVRRRALDRLSAAAARQFPSRSPLAWSAIDPLPDVPFAPHLALLECSVCTVSFQEGQALIHMPCSELHVFHRDCISAWLAIRSSCPLCRQSLTGDPDPPANIPAAALAARRASLVRRSSSLFDEDLDSALTILQPRSHRHA
jgi:hypothetical protein